MINLDFSFIRGDTFEKVINITWNKEITEIYFTVKEREKDKEVVLQKKIGNGITKTKQEDNTSSYIIVINATDTDDFETDYDYWCDIEVLSNNIKKTVGIGTLTLTTDITTTADEV